MGILRELAATQYQYEAETFRTRRAEHRLSLVMLPALGIAPPETRWRREDTAAKDALDHAVYAVATGVAYALLDRRERRRGGRVA